MKGEQQHQPQPAAGEIEPKIYVASLSDYNNGQLHGEWLQAAREPAHIHEGIDAILKSSSQPGAEEWAIHDYEGFGAFRLGEYDDINMVATIARGIVEHGSVYSHWANIVGTQDTRRLDRFEDHYRGAWDSLAGYADDLLDDMGVSVETLAPGWLRPYVSIDTTALGQDMTAELETARDPDGTVHIFDPET